MYDTCIELFTNDIFAREKIGHWLGPILFIRQAVTTLYDVLPLFCLAIFILSSLILMFMRRQIAKVQSLSHVEWRVFFHGFIIFAVYGIASIINIVLRASEDPIVNESLAQFLMFVYVILDVTTILLIPLCIFIIVPSIRKSP
ncbi:hypothetical protein PMAYCL1PPCAC_17137, partial [Pristionchus mayeri]